MFDGADLFASLDRAWRLESDGRHEVVELPFAPLDTYAGVLPRLLSTVDPGRLMAHETLMELRRVRFQAHVLPLPPADALLWGSDRIGSILTQLENLSHEDWALAEEWTLMADSVRRLRLDFAPSVLWTEAQQRWNAAGAPRALVVRRHRDVPIVEELARGLPGNPIVMAPPEAAETWIWRSIFVFGPPAAYPDWLMNFPRAEVTTWLQHASASKRLPATSYLEFSTRVPRQAQWRRLSRSGPPDGVMADELSEREQELMTPVRDWQEFAARGTRALGLTQDEAEDVVRAYVVVLDGEIPTFLSAEPDTTTTVLDIDSADVRQELVANLHPGMYVILRTEGGGDFVREVADSLLGPKAISLRQGVGGWKHDLTRKLHRYGTRQVAQLLRKSGLDVDAPTIRTWSTEHVIGPGTRARFRLLMGFLDRSDVDEQWGNIQRLRQAHRKAGHRVREMLLAEVRRTDISKLRRSTHIDFTLQGEQGGKLTAFRIEAISGDLVEVPRALLHRVGIEEVD